jgi:hypothetical protein
MADGLLNKASIILTPTGYKAGTLYNVAPVVEPYEDFDFARASVASRVNSSGLVEMVGRTLGSELVTNGDFDTDSDWEKQTNWTIANGSANSNGTGLLYQTSVSYVDGKTYKVTFDASITSGGGTVRLGNTTPSTAFTNGSNIFYLQTDASNTTRYIFFQGNSFVGSIDNVSVKEVIDTNNIPRISYDSNGDNGHILLEPTSTNLVTYSEDFSQWAGLVALSIGLNQGISPNGSIEANLLSIGIDSSSTRHRLYNLFNFVSGDTYTYSIFAKKNENDWFQLMFSTSAFDAESYANFDLNNGVVGNEGTSTTADIIDYGNGWYRCSITCTASASVTTTYEVLTTNNTNSGRYPSYQSSAAVNVCFLWGAQLEELPYATSYIPTLTGSQETRATETATGAGSAELINSTEGVLYAEIAMLSEDDKASSNQIAISDGTTNNRVLIFCNVDGDILVQIKDTTETPSQAVLTALDQSQGGVDTAAFNKIAILYKSGQNKLFVNGSQITNSAFNNFVFDYSSLDNLEFGSGSNSNYFRGKVKALAVFNEALSDDELNNLTG